MKILVAGAAGQVGRELVEMAVAQGLTVCGYDSKTLDITDQAAVAAIIAADSPDCVINAAAYTAVDRAETDSARAYQVNRDGVAHLARACRDADIPLLHISTDYVFDGEQATPYSEDDQPNPTSVYGASKLAGEEILAATWHKHVVLRVSWVFGRHGNNFVKTMLRVGRERDELNVVDDQFGAPTGAAAIARVLLAIARHPQLGTDQLAWGVRHFASEPGLTWFAFANRIFAQATAKGLLTRAPRVNPITSAAYPTPVKRPANSKLITSKNWPGDIPAVCDWPLELDTVLASS
ncbi:MAG: dTDP-4-dehydrorhamnose reductase [Spongiibacteraceae bacterium]